MDKEKFFYLFDSLVSEQNQLTLSQQLEYLDLILQERTPGGFKARILAFSEPLFGGILNGKLLRDNEPLFDDVKEDKEAVHYSLEDIRNVILLKRLEFSLLKADYDLLVELDSADNYDQQQQIFKKNPNIFGKVLDLSDDYILKQDNFFNTINEAVRGLLEKKTGAIIDARDSFKSSIEAIDVDTPLDQNQSDSSVTSRVQIIHEQLSELDCQLTDYRTICFPSENEPDQIDFQIQVEEESKLKAKINKRIGEMTDAINEKKEAFKNLLTSYALIKIRTIEYYTAQINPLSSENDLDTYVSHARGQIQSIVSISNSMKQIGIEPSKTDQITAQADEALLALEMKCAGHRVNTLLTCTKDSMDRLSAIKSEVDTRVVFDKATKKQLMDEANSLFKDVQTKQRDELRKIATARASCTQNKDLLKLYDDGKTRADAQYAVVVDQHAAIISRLTSSKKGNAVIAKNDSLEPIFTTALRRFVPGADVVTSNLPTGPKTPAAVVTQVGLPVTYQTVRLEPGDIIRATAVFKVGTPAAPATATGILVQEHQGKVTDKTSDVDYKKLSPEQRSLLALKQAKMLVDNYQPGSGDIIVTGGEEHAEQATRLYAALLYLKQKNPKLADVDIVSRAVGCQLPDTKWYQREAAVRNEFIKTYFLDELGDAHKAALGGVVTDLKTVLDYRSDQSSQMKKALVESKKSIAGSTKLETMKKAQEEQQEEGYEKPLSDMTTKGHH